MKTRVNLFTASILLAFVSSCGDAPQFKNGDTVFFPDTIAFKKTWQMNEKQMREDLFSKDSLYNQLELDTMQLSYSMFDGPDWIDRTKGNIDCRECTEFYIEAADSSLKFPGEFRVSGNTVRFYGVLIPGVGIPNDREFTVPDPIPWTVFRYYGYEVVRPYEIWGPQMKEFQEPSDTLEYSLKLTIQ